VMHAVAPSGEVAAVCTAVAKTLPRLGQPMYYFRCFVGKAWRRSHLGLRLLREAQRVLEDYARAHAFPCIGMLLELENAMFANNFRTALWPTTGFVYIGKSARGLELRVWYFRDAELKGS